MNKTTMPLWMLILGVVIVWVGVDGVSPSGPWPAVVALGWGLALFGLGYVVLRVLIPGDQRADLLLVALAAGIIIIAAAAQIAAVRGIPLRAIFYATLVLGLPGLWLAYGVLKTRWQQPVPYGKVHFVLAILVAFAYLLPISLRGAVPTPDGGRLWMYIDVTYPDAITSTVSTEAVHPPRWPIYFPEPMVYHFGSDAMASLAVRTLRVDSGDALMRVVRALGLFALLGVVAAFGLWTANRRDEALLASPLATLGVFLLCNSCEWLVRYVAHLSLFPRPFEQYKWHLLVGNGLWGLISLFLVAGLLVRPNGAGRDEDQPHRLGAELLLAPVSLCLHQAGGALATALVLITGIIFGWRHGRTYFFLTLVLLIMGATGWAAGLTQHSSLDTTCRLSSLYEVYWKLLRATLPWLVSLGLSFRFLAFLTFSYGRAKVVVTLIVLGALCLAAYTFLFIQTNEDYAIILLSGLVSGYAAAPAATLLLSVRGVRIFRELPRLFSLHTAVRWLGYTMVAVAAVGIASLSGMALVSFFLHGQGMKTLLICALAIILIILSLCLLRSPLRLQWSQPMRAVLGLGILSSAVGLIPEILYTTFNPDSVTLDSGRVKSLLVLHAISAPSDLIATAHHMQPGFRFRPARSFTYATISARYMLVEGWEYGGVQWSPAFPRVLQDNDTLFATSDPERAHSIVSAYGIKFILTEPGHPLRFTADGVAWLRPIPNVGSLGIWQVLHRSAHAPAILSSVR